jgi:hypothetical protein
MEQVARQVIGLYGIDRNPALHDVAEKIPPIDLVLFDRKSAEIAFAQCDQPVSNSILSGNGASPGLGS